MRQLKRQKYNTSHSSSRADVATPPGTRPVNTTCREEFGSAGASFAALSTTQLQGAITATVTAGFIGDLTGVQGIYVPIAPGTLGTRCANLGDCFTQYKVNSIRVIYTPLLQTVNTLTAATFNNVSGSVDYGRNWQAVAAWIQDPALQPSSFTPSELLQSCGKVVELNKRWSFDLRQPRSRRQWLYQPIPANGFLVPNSMADLRSSFYGSFALMWLDASNTPISRTGVSTDALFVQTGTLEVLWNITFRFPVDPDFTRPSLSSAFPASNPLAIAQIFTAQNLRSRSKTIAPPTGDKSILSKIGSSEKETKIDKIPDTPYERDHGKKEQKEENVLSYPDLPAPSRFWTFVRDPVGSK